MPTRPSRTPTRRNGADALRHISALRHRYDFLIPGHGKPCSDQFVRTMANTMTTAVRQARTLFAALNTADGSVISSLHRKHRAIEFRKFLAKIDAQVPEGLDIHLICDNYQTHKTPVVKTWPQNHPRFHMHFTPTYSSWLNQVQRFFGFVTEDLLRPSDHRSVQALESDIRKWVSEWNTSPTPFTWTKTAEQILESIGRLLNRISGAGH